MMSSSKLLWRHSPRKLLWRLVDFLRFDLAIESGLLVALDCSETRVELESIDLRPIRSLLEFVIGVDVAAFEIGRWWPSTNRARSESDPIKLFEIVFVVGVVRFSDWLNCRMAFLKLRIFEKLLLRKHGIFHLKIVLWSTHAICSTWSRLHTHIGGVPFNLRNLCISLDTNKLIKSGLWVNRRFNRDINWTTCYHHFPLSFRRTNYHLIGTPTVNNWFLMRQRL